MIETTNCEPTPLPPFNTAVVVLVRALYWVVCINKINRREHLGPGNWKDFHHQSANTRPDAPQEPPDAVCVREFRSMGQHGLMGSLPHVQTCRRKKLINDRKCSWLGFDFLVPVIAK